MGFKTALLIPNALAIESRCDAILHVAVVGNGRVLEGTPYGGDVVVLAFLVGEFVVGVYLYGESVVVAAFEGLEQFLCHAGDINCDACCLTLNGELDIGTDSCIVILHLEILLEVAHKSCRLDTLYCIVDAYGEEHLHVLSLLDMQGCLDLAP